MRKKSSGLLAATRLTSVFFIALLACSFLFAVIVHASDPDALKNSAPQNPASGAEKAKIQGDVFFGLPNDTWDRFIICDYSMTPRPRFGSVPMRLAFVDSSGKTCHLKWLKDQAGSPESAARELSCAFEKIGGYLFQTTEKCMSDQSGDRRTTVLLVSEEYLEQHRPMKVTKYKPKPLPKEAAARIEKTRKMKIRKAWDLATLEDGSTYAVILFEAVNNKTIYSVVLISKKDLLFNDEENYEMLELEWLFEKGYLEDVFDILAAFKSAGGVDIARITPGYEGFDSVFVRQKGSVFESVVFSAFYAGGF